jgi:hypothetical protein
MQLISIAKKWIKRTLLSPSAKRLPWDSYHERMSQRELADLIIPPEEQDDDVSWRTGQTRHNNSKTDQKDW